MVLARFGTGAFPGYDPLGKTVVVRPQPASPFVVVGVMEEKGTGRGEH